MKLGANNQPPVGGNYVGVSPKASEAGWSLAGKSPSRVFAGSVLVIIPTYNEQESLGPIVRRLRDSVPEADVLVVDDASPDGTGELAGKLSAADSSVHVLHRTGKNGLGTAYIAGFYWALVQGYDAIVEMDADGSHQPEQLATLLNALAYSDLVIGSRWIHGGRVMNWPRSRQILSQSGNTYVRLMLGIGLHDATAGYRVYRSTTLRRIELDQVQSQGYCFQVDLTLRTLQAGMTVTEVPITFIERSSGSSKMSRNIIIEALWMITRWGISIRWETLRRILGRSLGHMRSD
jgi:dolichol-phosphate mannosyltransferase